MSTLKIDLGNQGKAISPMLYGIFFEDINRAADGGLYANLIANGSFDYPKDEHGNDMRLACWEKSGDARIRVLKTKPTNKVNPNYLRLESEYGGGVMNTGFGNDGFGIRVDEGFKIAFKARAMYDTVVSFRIFADGRSLAEGSVVIDKTSWTDYTVSLRTRARRQNARLEIILPVGGCIDIDCISMFPTNTFKRRRNGMRNDIARMIRDLKPRFMRFPGGCVVEGRSMETMYNWKKSIGPVHEREINNNRWQMDEYQPDGDNNQDYFQTLGLGFYEYFLFCEDIGAEPVPVMNCGMTCQWHEGLTVPVDELWPWIQDVLDLIEFANGNCTTEWGAKRAELGHPAPFNLKYIGIGNEQWGSVYFERYEKFYEVINEKHPEIMLITSAGWNSEGEDFDTAVSWMKQNKEKAFAVDEHFYKSPEWFLENVGRYNDYDRTMPKVFAGEYACHTARDIRERRNNWYAALCEAAFMTGMENNADHVWMACYAPLLAKAGFDQWRPDLIWFNNLDVYGTPSYYVQKEFSRHYGAELIGSSCEDKDIHVSATADEEKLYIKIVNTSSEKKYLTLDTPGTEIADAGAEVLVIQAEPDAENSFDKPDNVMPEATVICIESGGEIEVLPYSVMIITVR